MLENFLDEIKRLTVKEVYQLSPLEAGFLKARVSYLTDEEKKKFESILAEQKTSGGLSYGELKSKAKKLGLTVRVGVKKVDLLKMIEDAEKVDEELQTEEVVTNKVE